MLLAAWAVLKTGVKLPAWMAVLAGLCAVNIFTAPCAYASLETSLWFLAAALLGWLAWRIPPERSGFLLVSWLGVGAALALYGVYQLGFGFEAAMREAAAMPDAHAALAMERLGSGRIFCRFALPATYGGWLILLIPPAMAWTMAQTAPARRIFGVAVAALLLCNLALTFAWGPVAALGVAALPMLWRAVRERRKSALVLAGLAAAAAGAYGTWTLRESEIFARPSIAHPVEARLANWEIAAALWKESPWLGKGLGNYGIEYPRLRRRWMNETRYAHNSYLQLLAEAGLAVLPLMGFLLWRWARGFFHRANVMGTGLETGCLAFLIHNAVDFTLFMPGTLLAFAMAAGLLMRRRAGDAAEKPAPSPSAGGRANVFAAAGRYASMLLLLMSAGTAFFMQKAVLHYENARFAMEGGGSAEEALHEISLSKKFFPWRAEPFIYEARIWLRRHPFPGALERARANAERAVALNPHMPFYHAVLGKIYLKENDYDRALDAYAQASRLYPVKAQYAWQVKRIRQLKRRHGSA